MRTLIRISAIFSAMALLVSCAVTPKIEVNPATINAKAAGGKTTVTVQANCDWTVKSDQGWASARKNESDGSLTVNVSKNNTTDSRSALITLSAEGASATINVNQEQKNSLVIDGDFIIDATEKAQETSVKLKANTDYKVTISNGAKWIKFKSITKGIVETSAVFSIEANDSFESRTADIIFEAPDCTPVNAKINQYGKARFLVLGLAGVESFDIPAIENDEKDAFVNVNGQETPYEPGMSVPVNSAGDEVTVKVYQMQNIQMNGIGGVTKLDISRMF